MNKMITTNRRFAGFTLLEVLVSIVVFSIGLIGIAKLQIVSKQSSYDSLQRVIATSLVQSIVDRMRSNGTELATYVTTDGSSTLGGGTISTEPTPTCVAGNTCTALQLALHDRWEIEQAVDGVAETNGGNSVGGLASPTICLTGSSSGAAGVYTVALAWRGKMALSNPTIDACGSSTTNYGTNNVYRRVIVLQTYINDE